MTDRSKTRQGGSFGSRSRVLTIALLAGCAAWGSCGPAPSPPPGAAGPNAAAAPPTAANPGTPATPPNPKNPDTPAHQASSQTPATPQIPQIPPIDACALLTHEDARAVAPAASGSGSLSSTLDDAVGRDPSQCAYPLSSSQPVQVISLTLRRLPSAEQAGKQQQADESGLRSLSSGAVETVPHLGDSAFWVGGQLAQLHVLSGDTILIFTVQIDKEPLRAAHRLADQALARLARLEAPGAAGSGGPTPGAGSPPAPRPGGGARP